MTLSAAQTQFDCALLRLGRTPLQVPRLLPSRSPPYEVDEAGAKPAHAALTPIAASPHTDQMPPFISLIVASLLAVCKEPSVPPSYAGKNAVVPSLPPPLVPTAILRLIVEHIAAQISAAPLLDASLLVAAPTLALSTLAFIAPSTEAQTIAARTLNAPTLMLAVPTLAASTIVDWTLSAPSQLPTPRDPPWPTTPSPPTPSAAPSSSTGPSPPTPSAAPLCLIVVASHVPSAPDAPPWTAGAPSPVSMVAAPPLAAPSIVAPLLAAPMAAGLMVAATPMVVASLPIWLIGAFSDPSLSAPSAPLWLIGALPHPPPSTPSAPPCLIVVFAGPPPSAPSVPPWWIVESPAPPEIAESPPPPAEPPPSTSAASPQLIIEALQDPMEAEPLFTLMLLLQTLSSNLRQPVTLPDDVPSLIAYRHSSIERHLLSDLALSHSALTAWLAVRSASSADARSSLVIANLTGNEELLHGVCVWMKIKNDESSLSTKKFKMSVIRQNLFNDASHFGDFLHLLSWLSRLSYRYTPRNCKNGEPSYFLAAEFRIPLIRQDSCVARLVLRHCHLATASAASRIPFAFVETRQGSIIIIPPSLVFNFFIPICCYSTQELNKLFQQDLERGADRIAGFLRKFKVKFKLLGSSILKYAGINVGLHALWRVLPPSTKRGVTNSEQELSTFGLRLGSDVVFRNKMPDSGLRNLDPAVTKDTWQS